MLTETSRPRVSRETRRLLAAVGLALLALWSLARLRFPDRPSSPDPVSPVLTQLSPPTTFADLSAEVERVTQRIAPLLSDAKWGAVLTWPWRDDLGIAIAPTTMAMPTGDDIRAFDRPTGFALVRMSRPLPAGTIWPPERLDLPRYLFSASPAPSRPAVVPAYVSSLEPHDSQAWSTEIWKVPVAAGLAPGALVFTAGGEWVGIAADENGERVIVPAAALIDLATRINGEGTPGGGDLGIEVQDLDVALAAAVNTDTGVIVAWVDPSGASATALSVGDVIEALNGEGVPTTFAWMVQSTRLDEGASVTLKVRRGGEVRDVPLTVPSARAARSSVLGLSLIREPGLGSRVAQIAPSTAADRAGIRAGDIVTHAGEQTAPTPAQIRRAFDAASDSNPLLLAITRANRHRLVALTP